MEGDQGIQEYRGLVYIKEYIFFCFLLLLRATIFSRLIRLPYDPETAKTIPGTLARVTWTPTAKGLPGPFETRE